MSVIRLCLLGAGRWGKRYIETIDKLDGVQLAVLASRNPASEKLVPDGCRLFADWKDAVTAPDVDAVIVATPAQLHRIMALAAIAAHRPVLIEKPLTLSVADADAIQERAEQAGVLVMVGHTLLFNPGFRELKRQLLAIGAIYKIQATAGNWGPFRTDVTPLWDWAPHDLAMCLDLLGMPKTVTVDRRAAERIEGGWGGNYRISLQFPNEVSADIYIGNMMPYKRRQIDVIGEFGALIFDDIASTLVLRREGSEIAIPFSSERPLTLQIREFASAVDHSTKTDSSLRLGQEIVRIIASCDLDGSAITTR